MESERTRSGSASSIYIYICIGMVVQLRLAKPCKFKWPRGSKLQPLVYPSQRSYLFHHLPSRLRTNSAFESLSGFQ